MFLRKHSELSQFNNVADNLKAAELFVSFWSGYKVWACMTAKQRQRSANLMPKVGDEFQAVFCEYDQGLWNELNITDCQVPMTFMFGDNTKPIKQLLEERLTELCKYCLAAAEVKRIGPFDHMAPISSQSAFNQYFINELKRELIKADIAA